MRAIVQCSCFNMVIVTEFVSALEQFNAEVESILVTHQYDFLVFIELFFKSKHKMKLVVFQYLRLFYLCIF